MVTEIKSVVLIDDPIKLQAAYRGSFYTICGAGGELSDWVTGMNEALVEDEIGEPVAWYSTTGSAVNRFAGSGVKPQDQFPEDLTILLFPLEGLDVGKLALFKIKAEDRWFDDVIQNMRNR